jgi:hypothetical protein
MGFSAASPSSFLGRYEEFCQKTMTAKTQNEHHPCSLTFGIPTAPHVLRLP